MIKRHIAQLQVVMCVRCIGKQFSSHKYSFSPGRRSAGIYIYKATSGFNLILDCDSVATDWHICYIRISPAGPSKIFQSAVMGIGKSPDSYIRFYFGFEYEIGDTHLLSHPMLFVLCISRMLPI
jgi:hypothetical protein